MAGASGGSGSGGSTTGGQFLLQLLQKPHHHHQHLLQQQQQQQQQERELINGGGSSSAPHRPHHDPAVAAMGPTVPLPYPWLPSSSSSSSSSLKPQEQLNPWSSQPLNPTTYYPSPNAFIPELNYNIWAQPPASFPTASPAIFADQPRQHHGVLSSTGGGGGINGNPDGRNQKQSKSQNQKQENMLMFGSLVCEIENPNGRNSWDAKNQRLDKEITMKFNNGQKKIVQALEVNGRVDGLGEFHDRRANSHGFRQQQVAMEREAVVEEPRRAAAAAGPPGFSQRSKGKEIEQNVGQDGHGYGKRSIPKRQEPTFGGIEGNVSSSRLGLVRQLDHPGPPVGSNLHSAPALEIEESLARIHGRDEGSRGSELRREENGDEEGGSAFEEEDLLEHFGDSLVLRDEFGQKSRERRHGDAFNKDSRSNRSRQPQGIGQQRKNFRRQVQCRMDIQKFTAPFLAIYESLVPSEEEKAKQKQLLTLLEKLVNKEWPRAQLFLYGSCANSFGVSNSDIDVCLAIDDVDVDKSEVLLRLADILQSDNLQEVQALTHARVPIVKLMDPVTGISCDICINNLLAVVNTKLLRDYGRIDGRLRQLAFLVKHWAKLRGVNITYQGTLSSYAYVIMCIHFLQQRRPAILPCLQEMTATYVVKVDDMECAYFDRVDLLRDFGKPNKESIAQLMWAFFDYWAYRHDYAKDVISVRTGSMISKHEKDWTRRIGRDRHLICIEDPFETSHDLGRVVDKYSIKVLREEFERAADILQYDPDPCVTLFEPYVPAS